MSAVTRQEIFGIRDEEEFNRIALKTFEYQSANNLIYREFLNALDISPETVKAPEDIPFLPVTFFKEHRVITGNSVFETVFESSGTTGKATSKHYISDLSLYEESFLNGFRLFYGEPSEYFFAALLPSYSERENSSLIYMMNRLIQSSKYSDSGFFNNDPAGLLRILETVKAEKRKAILLGVSFALLDFAEKYKPDLSCITVIETGGMKGKRKEITREELHSVLKASFNLEYVHSEYGMTELLSQAWSDGNGLFTPPPWMRIMIRDLQDPLSVFDQPGKTGGINIIDLANINSCSYLSVNDLGKLHDRNTFEVLGRFDNSDIRGCNLLID